MRHRVQVTQHHIDYGMQGSSGSCPVAMAIEDSGLGFALVYAEFALVRRRGGVVTLVLPEPVQRFVKDYDGGARVAPIEFEVEVP